MKYRKKPTDKVMMVFFNTTGMLFWAYVLVRMIIKLTY